MGKKAVAGNEIKTIIKMFCKNQNITMDGLQFIERDKVGKKTMQEAALEGKDLVLIMQLNKKCIQLKDTNNELWQNLTQLIELTGFTQVCNKEQHLLIYKNSKDVADS
jgi:hypothetical protein